MVFSNQFQTYVPIQDAHIFSNSPIFTQVVIISFLGLDIRIKQLGFEELGTKCCAEGIIDENGVSYVDCFNFWKNHLENFDSTTIFNST
jgi:hypothetical protein